MLSDAQAWQSSPASNFGWIVIGVEGGSVPTAKRFATREHFTAASRPKLTVTYTMGPPCAVDITGDGQVNVSDFLAFLQLFAAGDPRADFTGDSQVNVSDFLAFLSAFAAGC
jgi:hypothetical protein